MTLPILLKLTGAIGLRLILRTGDEFQISIINKPFGQADG
jgi:hypothetical protein